MSGLIFGPRANFGSKTVDFRSGRADFFSAAPKGTKFCRTQGDFHSSFLPLVPLSVPKSILSGPKSALSDPELALSSQKSTH